MREFDLSNVTIIFLLVFLLIAFIIVRMTFTLKDDFLKNVLYKSKNLIIQNLVKVQLGAEEQKTLLVLGNGWNVSVDQKDKVIEHDPFFCLPKTEVRLLKQKNCEIITAYFPFECKGIEQAGWELAKFINKYYNGYKIVLIGHSKSGVCFANLSKWLNADGKNATIVTISAPYGGVKSDKENLRKLTRFQKWIYPKIIIPHQTNHDITKDSEFLQKIANFSGLTTRNFYNIKSVLPEISYNPFMLFFKWADNKFQIEGDGIVGLKEQEPPVVPKMQFVLEASHQSSMISAIKYLLEEGIL